MRVIDGQNLIPVARCDSSGWGSLMGKTLITVRFRWAAAIAAEGTYGVDGVVCRI